MSHLGLGPAPITRTIHCNRQYPPHFWYFWDEVSQAPLPIPEPAVTGYVQALRIEKSEANNLPTYALLLTLDCGFEGFTLTVGAQSDFAKQLILVLASLPCAQLRSQPLTVQPVPREGETGLGCHVWSGRSRVEPEWPADRNEFKRLLAFAKAHVAEAGLGRGPRSVSPQLPPTPPGARPPIAPPPPAAVPADLRVSPAAQQDAAVQRRLAQLTPKLEPQDGNPANGGRDLEMAGDDV